MKTIALLGRDDAGIDLVADIIATGRDDVRISCLEHVVDDCARAWHVDARVFLSPALADVPLAQLALQRCQHAAFASDVAELGRLPALRPRTVLYAWRTWKWRTAAGDCRAAIVRDLSCARHDQCRLAVVTDVHARDEADVLRCLGATLWRVTRAGLPPVNHRADALAHYPVDAEIRHDGSVEDLVRVVGDLVGQML